MSRKTGSQTRFPALLPALGLGAALLTVGSTNPGQTTGTKKPQQNKSAPSSAKWIEDKVSVQMEPPSLSDTGDLVLAYTVTNKSGADITLDFTDEPVFSLKPHESTRVFFKLKDPPSYAQITPKEHRVYLVPKLFPADLPVVFNIIVVAPLAHDKPFWETSDQRLRRVLWKELGNAESIVIFIPDEHLKVTFPVPSGPKE